MREPLPPGQRIASPPRVVRDPTAAVVRSALEFGRPWAKVNYPEAMVGSPHRAAVRPVGAVPWPNDVMTCDGGLPRRPDERGRLA